MELEDLRRIIRESLESKIREIKSSRKLLPQRFEDFYQQVLEASEDASEDTVFENVYKVWQNISLESSTIEEWNDSLAYYVEDLGISKKNTAEIIKKLRR
jgi:uncharacterized protein HemY